MSRIFWFGPGCFFVIRQQFVGIEIFFCSPNRWRTQLPFFETNVLVTNRTGADFSQTSCQNYSARIADVCQPGPDDQFMIMNDFDKFLIAANLNLDAATLYPR